MERTPYQEQIIKRYYNNRESIMVQKLSELTTELYLSEGKKRQQVWKRITAALTQLGIEPEKIEQMVNTDNSEKLAEFLKKLT
jgi:SOS response regulatory protein OraA/RecX